MTRINFESPTDGARLNLRLLLWVTRHMWSVASGKEGSVRIQMANKGGAIPVLTVEPRNIIPMVRYYHPTEGFELDKSSTTLSRYVARGMFERG